MRNLKDSDKDSEILDNESAISDSLLDPNSLLKAPQRFNIMFLLYNYKRLGFLALKRILHITSGNLDHHMKKLIESEWIIDRIHFSPRPLKIYLITKKGTRAFKKEVKKMKGILDNLK